MFDKNPLGPQIQPGVHVCLHNQHKPRHARKQNMKPLKKGHALENLANAILDERIVQGLTAANSKNCVGDCQMVA